MAILKTEDDALKERGAVLSQKGWSSWRSDWLPPPSPPAPDGSRLITSWL